MKAIYSGKQQNSELIQESLGQTEGRKFQWEF